MLMAGIRKSPPAGNGSRLTDGYRCAAGGAAGRTAVFNYDPPSFVLTLVNVAEAFVPTA